jgi:hypothetical protein
LSGKTGSGPVADGSKGNCKDVLGRLMNGNELVHACISEPELSGASLSKISVVVKNIAKLRKCSDTGLKAGKLDDP